MRALRRLLPDATLEPFAGMVAALVRVSTTRFDVAVLDLGLPDGDGVALATELLRVWPDARVVFVTAAPDGALAARARALGPVVPKPWEPGALGRALALAAAESA